MGGCIETVQACKSIGTHHRAFGRIVLSRAIFGAIPRCVVQRAWAQRETERDSAAYIGLASTFIVHACFARVLSPLQRDIDKMRRDCCDARHQRPCIKFTGAGRGGAFEPCRDASTNNESLCLRTTRQDHDISSVFTATIACIRAPHATVRLSPALAPLPRTSRISLTFGSGDGPRRALCPATSHTPTVVGTHRVLGICRRQSDVCRVKGAPGPRASLSPHNLSRQTPEHGLHQCP